MNAPDPKANTTTEAYLAYKAGYLEESELKPKLYEPYLHFDGWLAYWAGLTTTYPVTISKKNLFDISKVKTNLTTLVNNGDGTLTVNAPAGSSSVGSAPPNKLSDFCPDLKVGDTAVLSMQTTGSERYIYLYGTGANVLWAVGTSKTITQALLDAQVLWYASGVNTSATISNIQLELGATSSEYEPYATPEMLTDEEALVAYLSGVTDTYPEDIKDPYDVRIVGYLKHLASARWPEPDYPVNNEEFYLSTMEPTHTSNSEPSADIELDTAEGKIISVEAYGDTKQTTYTGKNLLPYTLATLQSLNGGGEWNNNVYVWNGITYTINEDFTINVNGVTQEGAPSYLILNNSLSLTTDTEYILNGCPSGGSSQLYSLRLYDGGSYTSETGSGLPFTYGTQNLLRINIFAGITVNNLVFKPMIRLATITDGSYEPYVGGIPSPNPEYPQDVNVVTGRQTVKFNGKNLFSTENITTGKRLDSSGNFVNDTNYMTSDFLPVSPNTTYTYSRYESGGGSACCCEYGEEQTFILRNFWNGQLNQQKTFFTFTTGENTHFIRICDFIALTKQLEPGEVSTEYEPYQSQEYNVTIGENIFDISKILDNSPSLINNGDGTLTVTAYGTQSTAPNTLSAYCPTLQVGDEVILSADTTSTNKFVYLVGTNTQWNFGDKRKILASDLTSRVLWYSNNASTPATISNIKIVKPIELCKIGDHQDYIYKNGDDWYLHKECGHIQLDANIYGILQDGTAGVNEVSYAGAFYVLKGSWNTAGGDYDNDAANARISSNFGEYREQTISGNGAANSMVDGTFCQRSTNDRVYMRFSTLAGKTGNEVKAMLQEQGGTNFYYYLNTPSNTQITDSTLIAQLDALADADTYDEKTYIRVVANEPNLPALLKVEAYKY